MAKSDHWRTLHAAADAMERTIAARVVRAIADVTAAINPANLAMVVPLGVAAITDVLQIGRIASSIGQSIESGVQAIYQGAAQLTADDLGKGPQLRLLGSFNLTNPYAVDYARTRSADLVTLVDAQTKDVIRGIITRGFTEGRTYQQTAQTLRDVVGLNRPQSIALTNYAMAQRAIFGSANYPRTRPEVLAQRADDRIERYRHRLIRQRALMISRTETVRASNNGQQLLWREAQRSGYLGPNARRWWIITNDSRLCPRCAAIPSMNPEGVGLNEPFDTPIGPVMNPGEVHPHDRCAQRVEEQAMRLAA